MDKPASYDTKKHKIGFFSAPPTIRMEEEEDFEMPAHEKSAFGKAKIIESLSPDVAGRLVEQLIEERRIIIDSLNKGNISTKDKMKLLDENRQFMVLLRGGSPYKFGTEKVIYSILLFSAIVLVVLACLTAFYGLPKEVTITFVGTVLGGTIATIAQKLGKVGR
jgi:hypothetical protein